MTVHVDMSEIGKLQTLLGGAANKVTSEMPGVLDKVADAVAAQARANAPVDTGDLRASIGVLRKAGNAGVRHRWVGSELKQAWFQEFGTSRHPPQPFLNPAGEAGVRELEAELAKLAEPW